VLECITQTREEVRRELESLPGATAEWIERRIAAAK
jgi:hypothetical protein